MKTQKHTGRTPGRDRGRTGVMHHLQAKERQGLPAIPEATPGTDSPLMPLREHGPATTFFFFF